jgi:hypothetical protein
MNRKVLVLVSLVSVSLSWVLVGAVIDSQAQAKADLPRVIKVGSFGVGTSVHAKILGMGHAVQGKTGIKVIPIPRETEMGRYMSLRTRDVDFVYTTAASVSAPLAGITEFAVEAWGPQKLYQIWMGPVRSGPHATAKSGIKTLYDLKGKRVYSYPGTSSRLVLDALFAYAKLTWDDVIKVECSSWADQIRAAKIGKTDIWWGNIYAAAAKEMAGMPMGHRIISLPPEDKEAWARMQRVAPFFAPTYYENIPGELKNAWSISYPSMLICYDWYPADVAYAMTKGIWEGYDLYKDRHPELVHYTREYTVDVEKLPKGYLPYHPGSVKFFKETGAWTAKHEEWQRLCMKLLDERDKAWEEAKVAGKKKGVRIGKKGWGEFWEDYLEHYLSTRGFPTAPVTKVKR